MERFQYVHVTLCSDEVDKDNFLKDKKNGENK